MHLPMWPAPDGGILAPGGLLPREKACMLSHVVSSTVTDMQGISPDDIYRRFDILITWHDHKY